MVRDSTIKFNPDKSDVMAVATRLHGNITEIAKHYNVARDTIYQFMYRDKEGRAIIDRVRSYNTETDLDLAEHVVRYNMMQYEENPAIAQRAAEKVIDKKGHLRGWKEENVVDIPKNQSDIDRDHIIMTLEHKIAQLEANGNKPEAE